MSQSLPKGLLTIYGRKPVLEALSDPTIKFYRVHLASSNKPGSVLKDIESLCRDRGIELLYHDRLGLSRISKNKRQDQGVAADILARNFRQLEDFLAAPPRPNFSLLGVENVTNPQNLGMIIRAVSGGVVDGLILPTRGCAKLDGLVIKASSGSLFNAPLLFTDDLTQALVNARQQGVTIYGLSLQNSQPLGPRPLESPHIFVLGNETNGLSDSVRKACSQLIHLPMNNGVESLNVAVTAGILAFRPLFIDG